MVIVLIMINDHGHTLRYALKPLKIVSFDWNMLQILNKVRLLQVYNLYSHFVEQNIHLFMNCIQGQ